ncbi:hypothetical protein J3R83DRAFT_1656 [Lanmaoa asiatica]|nr:hypothetical protein J3R83DRAFT_1656 [Lanmaoa asiatica]
MRPTVVMSVHQLCRRAFATEATSSTRTRPNLHTAIILNRSPLLTRTPTPFEKAFYAVSGSHTSRLAQPFPTEFYFKQGSPLETRFNIEERRRERRAFGAPFGLDPSEERNEATELMEIAMKDEVDESMPRIHKADETNELKNLNRRGQRNLYLLLKTRENGKDVWRFPQGDVQKGEFLHVVSIIGLLSVGFIQTIFLGCTSKARCRVWSTYGHLGSMPEPNRQSITLPNKVPKMTSSSFTKPIFSQDKFVPPRIDTKTLHG